MNLILAFFFTVQMYYLVDLLLQRYFKMNKFYTIIISKIPYVS